MAARSSLGRVLARKYSKDTKDYSWHPFYHHGDIEGMQKLWGRLTWFVALPTVAIGMINTYLMHKEEAKTLERPEYKPYDHMYIMNKRFPWGDGKHSFFHNPQRNAVPGVGYEEEWKPHH